MKKIVFSLAFLFAGAAQAAPITYEGDLTNGGVFFGSTANENLSSSDLLDFRWDRRG